MPLDPILAELLAIPADPTAAPIAARPIAEIREETKRELAAIDTPGPEMTRVWEAAIPVAGGSIPVRLYRPTTAGMPAPALVYFHGGGWVQCDLDTHDALCRTLAHHGGCVVASVGYRLAPEHKFPVPLDDAVAATRWLAAGAAGFGIDSERLAVGGDSAGGNLAAAVAHAARAGAVPPLRFQLLLYPVTDLAAETESRGRFGKGYWLDNMPFYTAAYVRSAADRLDPRASPLRATEWSGLPPARIVTAEFDPLRDEGAAYASRLRAAGVPVDYVEAPGMIHGFLSLRSILPAGEAGLVDCGRALAAALGGRSGGLPGGPPGTIF